MLLVVVWRIVTHLCCQPRERGEVATTTPPVVVAPLPVATTVLLSDAADDAKITTPLTTTVVSSKGATAKDEMQIGWMTEAKDWAGELISGQSMVIIIY